MARRNPSLLEGASHSTRDTKWVYFCQPVSGGPIKIGIAIDPRMRLYSLQAGSPVALRMLAIMRGGAAKEAELHARFADYRLHGEWFEPDAPGLAELMAEAQAAIHAIAAERLPELEAAREQRARRLGQKLAERRAEWRT